MFYGNFIAILHHLFAGQDWQIMRGFRKPNYANDKGRRAWRWVCASVEISSWQDDEWGVYGFGVQYAQHWRAGEKK